jgi:multicomponent Na+:H+ antiporter subunit D
MIFGVDALSATGQSGWLTLVAGATIVAASLVALKQENLKRRLAYSTVSQLSYVVLGAAVLMPLSIVGAVLHIATHAWCKITLFFAAGSLDTAARITDVSQLDGIGRRMPWTMGAFAVGALGMIGVPPTSGFLGKWFMLQGAVQSSNWVAVGVIVVSTVLTAGYFLPLIVRAFFRPPAMGVQFNGRHADEALKEAPWPIVLSLVVTAIGSLALFFLPGVPLLLATLTVGD